MDSAAVPEVSTAPEPVQVVAAAHPAWEVSAAAVVAAAEASVVVAVGVAAAVAVAAAVVVVVAVDAGGNNYEIE